VLGSSPHAVAAYHEAATQLNVYPDSRHMALRGAIAERYRLEADRLVFGCGSDEIFAILNQVYLEPGDNIVMGQYGFSAYAIGARACQAEVRFADEPKLTTHVDNMLALIDERTRLVFFANPSNPTGTILPDAEVRRLHAGLPTDVIMVIDGAYAEFCDAPEFSDGLDLARTAENVLVTRTFSKLHGLAGLRVGWAYGPLPVVQALDRIRLPFNVVLPGHAAAVAALADEDFQQRSLALVHTWLPWLTSSSAVWASTSPPRTPTSCWSPSPRPRQDGGRSGGLPRLARPDRARRGQLRPAGLPAHHRGTGRAQPRGGRRHRRLPEGLTVAEPIASPIYDTIAVIGCGLVGGSLVRAARQTGAARTIVIAEQGPARVRVEELGLGDRVTADLCEAVKDADLVVFATPCAPSARPRRSPPSATSPAPPSPTWARSRGAVGQALRASAPDGVFVVPGHPIAGTEHSGPDSGFPELFENRWTILTPSNDPSPDYQAAVDRLARFWTALGAKVETMDEQHHDLVLAVTSHLPHLIAYNIVGTADDLEKVTQTEVMKYSAGGFRDFTRIAASDPVMWRDVFLTNRDAVLEILGRFQEDLHALSRHIRMGDGDALQALFTAPAPSAEASSTPGRRPPSPTSAAIMATPRFLRASLPARLPS